MAEPNTTVPMTGPAAPTALSSSPVMASRRPLANHASTNADSRASVAVRRILPVSSTKYSLMDSASSTKSGESPLARNAAATRTPNRMPATPPIFCNTESFMSPPCLSAVGGWYA